MSPAVLGQLLRNLLNGLGEQREEGRLTADSNSNLGEEPSVQWEKVHVEWIQAMPNFLGLFFVGFYCSTA